MVLSNYKMHTDSNTEFQNLIPVITSNVSSNRIKIQEILLILQLETGYFSKLFISESAPFEAVAFQNCYSTRRSPTGFFKLQLQFQLQLQLQFYKGTHPPMQHLHLHVCTLHYTSIQRILHPEIQFYMQKTKSSSSTTDSRNSTHRRQGDLLEMHPCVLQDLPVTFQAFQPQVLTKGNSSYSNCSRDIPDIPVIHDLPAFPGNSSNSTLFQYLQGFHPIPAFSD